MEALETLAPQDRAHPDVLWLRLAIFIGLQKWESAAALAEGMIAEECREASPIMMGAYAVRRCRSVGEELEFLNRGAEWLQAHPTFWCAHACFVCQLGDLEAAKIALSRAFKLSSELRSRHYVNVVIAGKHPAPPEGLARGTPVEDTGGSEVSGLMGQLPSRLGYQPTMGTELARLEERIAGPRQAVDRIHHQVEVVMVPSSL